MQLLHSPEDPHLEETLRYIVQYALESTQGGYRVDIGKVTMACTSDALKTQSVTFNKTFKSAPFLITSINPAVTSSVATKSESSITANGFTAQVYTSSNQNVDFTYLAIGPV